MQIIYRLYDRMEKKTRYVGRTTDVRTRFIAHLNLKKCPQWIRDSLANGYLPLFSTLELVLHHSPEIEEKRAKKAEATWIEYYLDRGEPLTNIKLTSKRPQQTHKKKPPRNEADLRKEIAMQYIKGVTRGQMCRVMHLSTAWYWLIREVCNEIDEKMRQDAILSGLVSSLLRNSSSPLLVILGSLMVCQAVVRSSVSSAPYLEAAAWQNACASR